MVTKQTNVRIPDEMLEKLKIKADKLGMTVSAYIKYLIAKDIEK